MALQRWRTSWELVAVAAVFTVALWFFACAAQQVPFGGDESDYIWTGRYFLLLFVQRDLTAPDWGDNYWTHTQPMLTRYIVGGWLWARGSDLGTLPPPYDIFKSREENEQAGRVTDPALLAEARTPAVLLAAGAVALLYGLGRTLIGPLAGGAAAILALGSPTTPWPIVRATPEAPLAFFLLLALLLGVLGARRPDDGGLPAGWAVATGVALGLALEAKLTAAFSLAAAAGWGGLVAAAALRGGHGTVAGRLSRAWRAGRGWALAIAVSVVIFVVANPHLYPNPPRHAAHLVEQRVREMDDQRSWFPGSAVPSPAAGLRYVLVGSLIDGAAGGAGLPDGTRAGAHGLVLIAGLAAAGAVGMLAQSWHALQRTARPPAAGLVLLTALTYGVGIGLSTHMYWTRYLVPTILLGALVAAAGLASTVDWLVTLGAAVRDVAHRAQRPKQRRPYPRWTSPGGFPAVLSQRVEAGQMRSDTFRRTYRRNAWRADRRSGDFSSHQLSAQRPRRD